MIHYNYLAVLLGVSLPQLRDEVLRIILGNLAHLPLHQLLAVYKQSDDVQKKAVTHVEDAYNLVE